MQKNCSNCGKDFHCGAARETSTGTEEFSCWCTELPHVGVVAAPDQDCLCPECLAQAIGAIEKLRGQQSDESNRDQVLIVPASD
jgi:hypothetical protein